MSFYPELENLNVEELLALFWQSPLEEEDPFLYYSEVANTIARKYKEGIILLSEQIEKADTPRLIGIIFALTQEPQNNSNLHNLLCGYLNDERPMVVAETIDALRRLEEKDSINKILTLQNHPSPYVRGSVLRYVARLYPEKAMSLLIQALNDTDFLVRENAADELGELGVVTVIPLLHPLLTDSSQDVREAAQTAIEMLEDVNKLEISSGKNFR